MIHRDIKPANIMIQKIKGDSLFLRVLDFGLVKFFSESPETTLARGTPLYMAPEQLQGRNIGPWTDVYATGLILYELLTGRKPFLFQPSDLLYSYKLDPSYSVLNEPEAAHLPEPLRAVIDRATQVEPEDRFQSAEAFHDAMEAAFEGCLPDQETVPAVSGVEMTASAVAGKLPSTSTPGSSTREEIATPAPAPTTTASRFITVFSGRRRIRTIVLVIAVMAVLGVGGMFGWNMLTGGDEVRLSGATAGDQKEPALTRLTDGTVVAAWDSEHPKAERKDVFLRTLGVDGAPVGAPIRVNTTLEGDQEMPEIASLAGGGFVVIWTSFGQDGNSWGLFGQVFDGSLGRTSDEFPVNLTWTRGEQSKPAIAALGDGGFVVTWQSREADGNDFGIVLQRFSSTAERIGAETVINVLLAGPQQYPAAAAFPEGGYVVAWESDSTAGDDNYGILLRIFDDQGAPVTSEIQVNVTTSGRQRWPEVVALAEGGVVVAWSSEDQDGDMLGAYARIFDAEGNPVSGEVRFNDLATGNQFLSQLAAFDDGSFIGVWASDGKDGSGLAVVGAVFDAEGQRIQPEAVLNAYTQSDQTVRSILALGEHSCLVAWESKGQDGDGLGVYVRRIDRD